MLGIIIFAYIGHKFHDLAKLHQKHKWGYAILGIVTYFIGTFIAGLLMFIVVDVSNPETLDKINDMPDVLLNLIAVPFGILFSYLSYFFLKRNWEKQTILVNEDILDVEDELL